MNEFFNGIEGRRIVKFFTGVLVLLAVFLGLLSINLLKGLRDPNPVYNSISVNGTAEVTSTPNIATFSFSVSADASAVSTAQSTVTTKTNAILAGLKDLGIEDKDIKTADYSVYPKYTYQSLPCSPNSCPPSRQIADGYTVSQSITVKVRKTEDAGKALAIAGDKGATNISSLELTFDDPNAPQDAARLAAIDNAMSKADALAKHLGVKIVRVLGYYENGGPAYPMYAGGAYDKAVSAQGSVAPTIPVGQNKVTSNVTVTFEVR
jgi:uncharacterized protein YggE